MVPRLALHLAVQQRDVGLLHGPFAKLLHQLLVRRVGPRDHHRPGRPLVETVNDPGPQRAAHRGQSGHPAKAVQQRRHHRAAVRARARMDDHSGRLVDHGDIFVLVENIERNRFRVHAGGSRRRNFHRDSSPGFDAMRGLHRRRRPPARVPLPSAIGCGVRLKSGRCETRNRSRRSPASSAVTTSSMWSEAAVTRVTGQSTQQRK